MDAKNDVLDNLFFVSLNMLVAQYGINADIITTINFQWNMSTVI